MSEVPYQAARDTVEEKIAEQIAEDKIIGISAGRNESDLNEPVRLVYELKRDADPEVVLNQLYQFSPLQDTFSIIFLALVDGKPRVLSFKGLLEEFIRHRANVIRRRTQFLLAKARQRKHTVEGLLLAYANIDEVIRIIRSSATQPEAKARLMGVETPAALMKRALGDAGFAAFQQDRGVREAYTLTAVQADAILKMTLGQLVNLEQEKLAAEHQKLLDEIAEHQHILSDEKNILSIIRSDCQELKRKYGDKRITEISGEEIGDINMEDLIAEETMVVSLTHNGYIKRTPSSTYRAQRRGGKGIIGSRTEEEDPIQLLFVASTHDYLLFFTNYGKVYWQKVYDLPQLSRESRGRAVVNLLNLAEGEKIASCLNIRDFSLADHYLAMATRNGLVKKTALEAYSRPKRIGIIAINLREGDELVDVVLTKPGDELVVSSARGQAIRFRQSDVRPMGRNSTGVRGLRLRGDDRVVGMVVADPIAALLTACELGFGKRTHFGPNSPAEDESSEANSQQTAADEHAADETDTDAGHDPEAAEGEETESSAARYPTKGRGGLGVRDIRTDRNGPVVGIACVYEDDEVLMMTARGKIQRVPVKEIRTTGRNTHGVRIMSLEEGDTLAAIARVPPEEREETAPEAK